MIWVANHPKKYSSEYQYDHCVKLIKILMDNCNIRLEVYGLENIPEKDGFYLVSNHQEKFDPLAIWYTFPRRVGVILNDEATHRPFIREVCKLIKSKKLKNRKIRSVIQTFQEITEELSAGTNYMVFPEGDYEEVDGQLSKFHSGSFKSPKKAHCPILPVAIVDSFRVFDDGYKTTKPIQIHYLKPVMASEYENLSTSEIAEMIKGRIQDALNEFQK